MKARVCVLCTDGTNCDYETAAAFDLVGAKSKRVHVNQLRDGQEDLEDYQILALPGGFSYGDDVASGKILALELLSFLGEQLAKFVERQKPIIGICNGFQVLVRTGLLPFETLGNMSATLMNNDSGRFECRWINLIVEDSPCIFTRGMEGEISLQVAHGEGKFFAADKNLIRLEGRRLVALRYSVLGQPTQKFPANPNGSLNAVAGICSPSGLIFGLMPHPERFVRAQQHPNWRRERIEPAGLPIFRNAVEFVS